MTTDLTTQLAEALRRCEQVIRDAGEEDPGQWDWAAIDADEGSQARAALAAYAAAQPTAPAGFIPVSELRKNRTPEQIALIEKKRVELRKALDAAQSAPSEQPAQGEREAVESAAKAVFQKLPGWCGQPWVDGGNSLKQDEARRYARAALASQPAARVPLTWDQFVAACEAEYGEDFEPQVVSQATEEEKTQMLRVVRMVERAHDITTPAAQEKQG